MREKCDGSMLRAANEGVPLSFPSMVAIQNNLRNMRIINKS